ncbi:MMPL family transporter [Actinomadura barringtoniae]|uniref:MMPL family transporter n=1 Tax=Actinomadura barringtoniae TaxID=1427535 RepID=A0A939P5K3_9ACTN|nr:MMPL family transporter [Actinomadura barringtoniae]MBO2445565.1 MMPL family transporter [Actinomadura barringtoniae]
MFRALGRAVVRHPWWTIGLWLVAAVAIMAFAPSLKGTSDNSAFLPSKYESAQVSDLLSTAFSGNQKTQPAAVVVQRGDNAPLTAADQARVGALAKAIEARHFPNVTQVYTGPKLAAPDHSIQMVSVALPSSSGKGTVETQNEDTVKKLRTAVGDQLRGSGLTYGVTGQVATQVDNQESSKSSFALVGLATVVLILVLVLVIFRSPLLALMPLIVIGIVVVISSRLTAIVGNVFDLQFDSSYQQIVLVVLYGIGTDYMLFLVFRYRERLRAGDDKRTAMITTVERVGEAIASAAGVVVVAFLVLLLARFKAFGALGPNLAIAVACMFVTSMTLLPALVSVLGRGAFWPSRSWRKQPKPGMWARAGRLVSHRSLVAAVASGVVLIALALLSFGFKADYDFNAGYPQDTESAKAMKQLEKVFPRGELSPTIVLLKSPTPVTQQEAGAFAAKLRTGPGVGGAQPTGWSTDQKIVRIDMSLTESPASDTAIKLVKGPLRDYVHDAAPPGAQAITGGETAIYADINVVNDRDLKVIVPVAVVLIGLILALLLRSLVAPIYLAITVLLGFTATLGASVLVFQDLGGKSGLMFNIPIVLYLFVLAIGTDYNILVVARLREEYREGLETREAARSATEHAGPAVGAAGLILAGTFAALVMSPIAMFAEIGFGVAIGIVLSAFVVSTVLVPSLTALIGKKAWWPGGRRAVAPSPGPEQVAEETVEQSAG